MDKTIIEKYRKNQLSEEELARFIEWVKTADEDEVHAIIDEDMNLFVPDRTYPDKESEVKGRLDDIMNADKPRPSIWRKVAAIAASLLIPILIFGNIYFYNKLTHPTSVSTAIATDSRRMTVVTLPDGSSVELNQDSRVRYESSDFTKDVRTIDFEGEGYFKIAKSETAPFKIKSAELEVTVHGTVFNLKAYPQAEDAKLALIEGSVSLASLKTGEVVKIAPNEEATLNYASGAISIKKLEDENNATAWTTGKLRFNNAEMSEVILEIEEVYGCHLSVNKNLNGEHYTGVIPTDNILVAISILEKIYNVHISVTE